MYMVRSIALLCFLMFALVRAAFADANFIEEKDERRLWPINEQTQKIPKHVDARTGFIDPKTEQIINAANDKYAPDERQQVIDFCRHEALRKKTQLAQKPLVAKRIKDKSDGLLNELQEEFQYCAIGMLRSWAADDAQAQKDNRR